MLIFMLGCWGVGIPLAWLLSRHVLGPTGVWTGMLAGLAVTALLLLGRFRRMTRLMQAGQYQP